MEVLDQNRLSLFVIFVVPGFISMKLWGMLVATEEKSLSGSLLEAAFYGALNLALTSWIILLAYDLDLKKNHYVIYLVCVFAILFIFPMIWPVLLWKLRTSQVISKFILHPFPTSWDFFFAMKQPCFVIVHLKGGGKIGGLFYNESYASSHPQKRDIYLNEVWEIDETGHFLNKVPDSQGLWIDQGSFTFMEFLAIPQNEEQNESKKDYQDKP